MQRVSSKHTVNLPYFAAVQFLALSSPHLTLSHHCALTLALCRSLSPSLSLCLLHLIISFVCKLHPQPVQVGCNCTRHSQSRAHPSHTSTHAEQEQRQLKPASESTTGRAQLTTTKFVHAEREEARREWDRARERESDRVIERARSAVGLVARSFYWVKVIAGYCAAAAFCILFIFFILLFRFVSFAGLRVVVIVVVVAAFDCALPAIVLTACQG